MILKRLAIVLLLLVLMGCETLGFTSGDGAILYDYETERAHVAPTDSVEAAFVNRSAQTIYVFPGCPTVTLERRVNGSWQNVPIPIFCTMEAKPPLPVRSGEPFDGGLRARLLKEADVAPGTYRLVLSIGASAEGISQRATSNRFEIVEPQP
jgi:hypothetical protein